MASLKTLLPAAVLFLAGLADSFTFVPTAASATFPACGVTCPLLTQAQDACQVGGSNDQAYVNCFCSSSYLLGLKTSGAVCYTCTDATSQGQLVAWYNGYCNGGWTSTTTTSATSTTSTATAASTGSATTTGTSAPTSTGDSTSDASTLSANGQSGKSWYCSLLSGCC